MSLNSLKNILAILSLFACSSLFAAPLTVNVAGIPSVGEEGDSANTVLLFNVGANARITTLDYAVSLTAFSPSWLSEMNVSFTPSNGVGGVDLSPGFADNSSGTATYSDFIDLTDLGLDFQVGADGILRLEFFEDFDDFAGADGVWNSGTITVGFAGDSTPVPEPATVLLMGMGVMMIGYGRRRRAGPASNKAAS